MKNYVKLLTVFLALFLALHLNQAEVHAEENLTEKYERDYLSKTFDSENGLEGTTANCVCADEDGFLWFGSYTGLYRYDGTEFKKYLIDGRALPVKDIAQDSNGDFWIGTNGEGVYRFDGTDFEEYILDENEQGASVINEVYVDEDGMIWVGTKAGLFSINTKKENTVRSYSEFSNVSIQDIGELSTGKKVIILKTGEVFFLQYDESEKLQLESDEDGSARCFYGLDNDEFYIGTSGETILKVSEDGEVLKRIEGDDLSSFNEFHKLDSEAYWVCSDAGIGILQNDKLMKLDSSFESSVEDGCTDYQGSFWFVSSRQGILQLYQNHFSDMGSYWGISKTVNSIQPYQDRIYVGCEDGLYCFSGKAKIKDMLTEACRGLRIRQIYLDNENDLWVSTYEHGLKKMDSDGNITSFDKKSSNLGTDKTRCVWTRQNGEVLVGTEEGLYLIDRNGKAEKYTDDETLNTTRILDVKESYSGKIYASTDGYGVYEIEYGIVKKVYTKQQGLLSNVVMKVVPSENMKGAWVVTGEGISFIDEKGNVSDVTGISVANCLDMLLSDDGKAVILAGNGFFEIEEKNLLEENVSYVYLNKKDGLPIDFTANARNNIQGDTLYMCGTTGAASIDLNIEQTDKPIRLYINSVSEDGKDIDFDIGNIVFSASAHRINIDIQMINFIHRNFYIGYYLNGIDNEEIFVDDSNLTDISYTNLEGGDYTYKYKVYDANTDSCVASLSVNFKKNYKFTEQFEVRILLTLLGMGTLILIVILLVYMREKRIKKQYHQEYLRKKEKEISELAFKDLVTGVFNRNYFEQEKDKIDMKKMYALVSVSINHVEYFKNKYGIFFTEGIFRKGVEAIKGCVKEEVKICRVSENIFYFWFMEPVQLETYIYDIKEEFKKTGEKEEIPLSFSVGAIYNNAVGKENIDELIDRCDNMRRLDEKHAESKFIEGKMKMYISTEERINS